MIGPAELDDLLLDLRAAAAEDGVAPPDACHPIFWSVTNPEPSKAEDAAEIGLEGLP